MFGIEHNIRNWTESTIWTSNYYRYTKHEHA